MFERLEDRAARAATRRAAAKAADIAEAIEALLAADVVVDRDGESVTISGRRLKARYIGDANLRAALARAR